MGRGAWVGVAWASLALVGCSEGATTDPGLSALLRVQSAQFVAGARPAPTPSGPKVDSLVFATNNIWPGEEDKVFSGALDPAATAVALSLSDDTGYWIVPAGVPDFSAPTFPAVGGRASFASTLAPGAHTLEATAIDEGGVFGPVAAQTLTALSGPPGAPSPQGVLVVTLTWDTESDLDLHVVDPLGDEIYHGDPFATPPSSQPDASRSGYLDFDSNAGCIIDGLRREDVIWPDAPPAGAYLVRVDTPSLCGQPIAHFAVRAALHGVVVGQARGVSLDSSTWGPHDRGAGELVLTFDVP